MDPTSYEQSGLRLPEPQTSVETAPTPKRAEKTLSVSPEILMGKDAKAPIASSPTLPPPVAAAPTTPQLHDSPVASTTNLPMAADDADLIEKEWVLKAKAIVEHTKDDPHSQNYQMSRFKADYLKKRYNKDVKVSSES